MRCRRYGWAVERVNGGPEEQEMCHGEEGRSDP
jgi:hypothetical protein